MTQAAKQICQVLGWPDDQYYWFKYQQGCEYLKHFSAPAGVKAIIERSAQFWGWWKLLYNQRDEIFLAELSDMRITRRESEMFYRAIHHAEDLAACLFPNSWIIMPCYKEYTSNLKHRKHAAT